MLNIKLFFFHLNIVYLQINYVCLYYYDDLLTALAQQFSVQQEETESECWCSDNRAAAGPVRGGLAARVCIYMSCFLHYYYLTPTFCFDL